MGLHRRLYCWAKNVLTSCVAHPFKVEVMDSSGANMLQACSINGDTKLFISVRQLQQHGKGEDCRLSQIENISQFKKRYIYNYYIL